MVNSKRELFPVEELVFTRRLSKDSNQYTQRNTIENDVMGQLVQERRSLKAGESLNYIITKTVGHNTRAVPVEFADDKTSYDTERYIELLKKACDSVTSPFGVDIYDL